MQGFWRHPALPIGVVLLVLGFGNSLVSRNKLSEYERHVGVPEAVEPSGSLQGYAQLTARTNAMLLERLHRRPGDYGVVDARRDLYIVIHDGGRLIAALGVLLIGVGTLGRWREQRMRRAAPRSPFPPASAAGA
jgi:hypothetical protein